MASRQQALITGASSGIGAALARRMAARGVEVWLGARRADRLAGEVAAIEAGGGRAHAVTIDVSHPEQTAATVVGLDEACGGLDLVVANAGIGGSAGVLETTWQDVAATMQVNLIGALATLLPVMPRMVARGRGQLVGISSIAAELPIPKAVGYGTSKAALTFFLQSVQGDLAGRGVDVTIVHPGFVKSELTAKNTFKMPFLLETDEGARLIDEGIQRRARLVRFPLAWAALAALGRAVPAGIRDAVVTRNS